MDVEQAERSRPGRTDGADHGRRSVRGVESREKDGAEHGGRSVRGVESREKDGAEHGGRDVRGMESRGNGRSRTWRERREGSGKP